VVQSDVEVAVMVVAMEVAMCGCYGGCYGWLLCVVVQSDVEVAVPGSSQLERVELAGHVIVVPDDAK